MRRFAAVAPAGGRSFAAGFCAEGLFSPGVLRRKIFAADGSRGGSCGFRSYRLSKSGACVGRFASTLPHGTAPPGLRACRDACSGFGAPRSVHRGPCIGGRAVQPVFRGRAVRIGCLPPRCGGGMRRSAPSLSDAGRDRSMTRETAETQRTERAVARNGRIRFGDGAVRFAVGRMGPAGRSAVSTGGGVRTAGQPVRRAEGRIRSGNGKTRTRHGAAPGASRSGVRVRQTSGGGKTDVRLPDRKNGAETNMGRAAGAWS